VDRVLVTPKMGLGSGRHIRLDWSLHVNDDKLDFVAPWRQVQWMRDSLFLIPLPAGVFAREHQEASKKTHRGATRLC